MGFVPTLRRFRTRLFERAPRPHDVYQSELGDCYLASAAAAVAQARPRCLERAIVRVGAGTYRVRFRDRDPQSGRYGSRSVVVTSDLYVRPSGALLYGSSAGLREPSSLWWPVLEKAFARRKGSYERIGAGGCSHRVFELLLGRRPRHFYTDQLSPDALWRELTDALAARRPVVVGTFRPAFHRKYRQSGLHPDHAYTVLACRKVRGARKVTLRNPWGEDVARPGTVRKKGLLEIEFDKLIEIIEVISTVR
jgi:hypothetical protein